MKNCKKTPIYTNQKKASQYVSPDFLTLSESRKKSLGFSLAYFSKHPKQEKSHTKKKEVKAVISVVKFLFDIQ